jgi:preprotein translocase subunit SecF
MMVLIPKTNIDFVKRRFIFFSISAAFLLAGFISIAIKGINFGLDFSGGTLVQVKFEQKIDTKEVRNALNASNIEAEIQNYTNRNAFAIRVKGSQENVNEIAEKIITALKATKSPFEEERREFVGPAVGRDLAKKGLWAMILSLCGIIIYIAFRFKNPAWGAMGVIAIFHDVLVAVGLLSITNREIDLVILAALLTIAGYSINDTIVIFDRMRENLKNNVRIPLKDLINKSINETLSRTIITSVTVFLAVLILYVMGGTVINNFAFTMLVGTVMGTYSTIAIATPLLYQWQTRGNRNR